MVNKLHELRDWGVGVISTDYDLHKTRVSTINKIARLGFRPIAFDTKLFPVQPNLHSHDACVKAIEAMDIVVLLVDRRYGGLYLGKGPQSITEREFRKALLLKKPIIACVSSKAFDDRGRSKKEIKRLMDASGVDLNEAKRRVQPRYVDSWRVIDFIDTIQHSARDQYLVIFNDEKSLLNGIEERLKVMTPHICRLIAKSQVKSIDSYRSTSGLFESIGIVSSTDLFIDPPYRIVSGKRSREKKVGKIVENLRGLQEHVVISGQPGAGKSITLARGFRKHANRAIREKSFTIPFFVSLRGRGVWYHFNFEKYLSDCCAEFLGKKIYPAFYLRDIYPVFYMDGLDESSINPSIKQLQKLIASDMISQPFVLTMRSSFANQTIEQYIPLGSKVETHIEILRWHRTQALAFAKRFFRHAEVTANKDWLLNFIKTAPMTHPIIESPLLLALFLWLGVNTDGAVLKNKELGLASLFYWFLKSWASRELDRYRAVSSHILATDEDVKNLMSAWELAAWELFRSRSEKKMLALMSLRDSIGKMLTKQNKDVVISPAFASLFSIAEQSQIVTGMIHEQFLEYLIARAFVSGCLGGSFPLVEYLSNQINVDVTRFVKSMWASMIVKDLKSVLRRLRSIAIRKGRGTDTSSLMINANCVYYISRIPILDEVKTVLKDLLKGEGRLYSSNGILYSLVRLGDMSAEELLYNALVQNREANMINRGLHLEYFKDVLPSRRTIPPRDDGKHEWHNTLRGLISHIEATDLRSLCSRRIDIFTIRSLLRARGKLGPFTDDHFKRIKKSVRSREMRRLLGASVATQVDAEFEFLSEQFKKLMS